MPQQDRPNQPNREKSQSSDKDTEFQGTPREHEQGMPGRDKTQTDPNKQGGQQDKSRGGSSDKDRQQR